ncbi:hypothetical protein EV383_0708 [Pseudonocardia sediminis]|uniref:Uncharacterized protein n=1 Tax=Pseudonocardia sediminis TaxID=1397368 RepID=A0A4Q7UV01_PSEST|nr:hypothetical protein EV383_0708 [Pseudonocardia sediminis]
MPSSVIFVGLVVLWLLILVPAVARRQQEVARLSPALLSGRVLERPMRHRFPEVGVMERLDDRRTTTVGELVERRDDVPSPRDHDTADALERELDDELDLDDERDDHLDDERRTRDADDVRAVRYDPHTASDDEDSVTDRRRADDLRADDRDADDLRADDSDVDDSRADDLGTDDPDVDDPDADDLHGDDLHAEDDRQWERPPARYRPGRGGFDPEAAAVAAHAKYAFRQRVVLGLLVLLLASAAAALLVSGLFWWATGVLGAGLAGYLTYLRRQVRIEETIRDRRAARLAGTRRSAAADDPELDDWARRGREAGRSEQDDDARSPDAGSHDTGRSRDAAGADGGSEDTDVEDEDHDWTADDGEPSRIRGTGEPIGVLPARRRTTCGTGGDEPESTLPRLVAAPPPPIPAGTSLVDVDDEEQLDLVPAPDFSTPEPIIEHRRAAGE